MSLRPDPIGPFRRMSNARSLSRGAVLDATPPGADCDTADYRGRPPELDRRCDSVASFDTRTRGGVPRKGGRALNSPAGRFGETRAG
jgi:hypothetical protein